MMIKAWMKTIGDPFMEEMKMTAWGQEIWGKATNEKLQEQEQNAR